eukprot:gnl/TRDRNA2_/TRDRNA2_66510_c1_seq1.p1 gnl/TRDRNA2_/TRDRNA2_66510_c1~~gnl/TRDRNA2_/TRDRNA2_66510_c1_seq1.p1  ORF type:complete len:123 (+),score=7.12 gnl/TRDRNA2_/TRDRNA2_66510_c1_seq1:2-370(+)
MIGHIYKDNIVRSSALCAGVKPIEAVKSSRLRKRFGCTLVERAACAFITWLCLARSLSQTTSSASPLSVLDAAIKRVMHCFISRCSSQTHHCSYMFQRFALAPAKNSSQEAPRVTLRKGCTS